MGCRFGNVPYSEVLPKDSLLQPSVAASLLLRECMGHFPVLHYPCVRKCFVQKMRFLPTEQSVREGDGHLGCMSLGIASFINRH